MCGIAGWFCWGDRRPEPDRLKGLLLANQTRGTDAAGIAFMQPGNRIFVKKERGPARDFIRSTSAALWSDAAQSPRGLLHARAATKGKEDHNENNHPIAGLGWVVVHNGHVHNDDDLWEHYGGGESKRFAEVDSSAIPLALSQGKNFMDSLQYITLIAGGATCALWSQKDPEKMALFRLGNNNLYMFLDEDILYWSSAPIAGRIMPGRVMGSIPFLTMAQLPDERLLILDPANPKMGAMFKIDRKPFFAKRVAPKHQHTHSGGTTTQQHGGSSSLQREVGEVGETSPRLKWERKDIDAKFGKRPVPQLPKPEKFDWSLHSYPSLMAEAKRVGRSIRVETLYGRWHIIRGADATYRYFKPHKGQKKFIKRNWKTLTMPAPLKGENFSTDWDFVLPFEYVTLSKHPRAGLNIVEPGLICPWCGIWAPSADLFAKQDRCSFCNIRSGRGGVTSGV